MQNNQLAFLPISKSCASAQRDLEIFDWRTRISNEQAGLAQDSLFGDTESQIDMYRSGASAKSDLLGLIDAAVPVGLCVIDTSSQVRSLMAKYISAGGKVFLDSGAFRHFKKSLKDPDLKPLDFDYILGLYEDVIGQCDQKDTLIIVAPDRVEEQQGSYLLLEKYAARLRSIHALGVNIMVPLQKGGNSIATQYKRTLDLLGFDFIVGIPSNAEALSHEDTVNFIGQCKPPRVHFLGCSESALIHMAQFKSPTTLFSCDATRLRAHIGTGRLLTDMHRDLAGEYSCMVLQGRGVAVNDVPYIDETDAIGDISDFIDGLPPAELKRFSTRLSVSTKQLLEQDGNDEIWALVNAATYGMAEQIISQYIADYAYRLVSPQTRRYAISELTKANII